MIDNFLLWLVPAYLLLSSSLPDRTDESGQIDLSSVDSWRIAVMVLLYPVVEGLMVAITGRSPGKALLGLRVVRYSDGGALEPSQAFVRAVIVAVPFVAPLAIPSTIGQLINVLIVVIFFTMLRDPLSRGIQDRAAATIVLRTR